MNVNTCSSDLGPFAQHMIRMEFLQIENKNDREQYDERLSSSGVTLILLVSSHYLHVIGYFLYISMAFHMRITFVGMMGRFVLW